LGLREDAIKQYEDKRTESEAKDRKERENAIARQVARAKDNICKRFGLLSGPPEITLTESPGDYYPNCSFEIGGVQFEYILGNMNLCVKITCPKCESSWLKSVSVSTVDGKTDLSDLGHELSKKHYNCPADRSEMPQPPPRPPVKTVEYALNSVEVRILDTLNELISYAVQNHEH